MTEEVILRYESVPHTLSVVGKPSVGQEDAASRVVVLVFGARQRTSGGDTRSGVHSFQIWLTIPQVSAIVWWWFLQILPAHLDPKKDKLTSLLMRLMRVRWNRMTSSTGKARGSNVVEGFQMPLYYKPNTGPR